MAGTLAVMAGVVFLLQSIGIVGPDSSFMVRNSEWTRYGFFIVLVGVVTVISGIILRR